MSASSSAPLIDPALLGKLQKGDERAFEQIFRAQFIPLATEVQPLLNGDGASAARAVSNVFTQMWKSREDFASVDDLRAFLDGAVHAAAARINSQHAVAHELSVHEGARAKVAVPKPLPSVDEVWAKVERSLHANEEHAAEVAHEMSVHSRHEAAGHLADIAKPRPRGPMIALIVVTIVIVGAFLIWTNRGREAAQLTSGLASPDARPMQTAIGEFSKVTLSDKSTVKLGPDSKLLVPKGFGSAVRGLKLDGTATFSVAPGQKRRFIVRAGSVVIAAQGTEFTVRAYPDEHIVTIGVRDGDITATLGDSVYPVAKGAAVVITADSAMRAPSASELEQALGWIDGTVFAADRPLREVLVLAKRWFGLNMMVADTALFTRKVTLRAGLGLQKEAITSIETSGSLKRIWEGDNMVLTDRAGKAAPGARAKD